jgi:predicted phosphodiesterase
MAVTGHNCGTVLCDHQDSQAEAILPLGNFLLEKRRHVNTRVWTGEIYFIKGGMDATVAKNKSNPSEIFF